MSISEALRFSDVPERRIVRVSQQRVTPGGHNVRIIRTHDITGCQR